MIYEDDVPRISHDSQIGIMNGLLLSAPFWLGLGIALYLRTNRGLCAGALTILVGVGLGFKIVERRAR